MTKQYNAARRLALDTKLQWVLLEAMRPAEIGKGQRELTAGRVHRITSAGFDPEIMGFPVVSHRDGHFWIIDGQARVEACKAWLGEDWHTQSIQCRVFDGLTQRDEARIFLSLNAATRVDAFSTYVNAVSAGLPDESDVDRLVRREGLVVSREDHDNAVGCVAALMRVYRRGGGVIFASTMRTVRDAYGRSGMRTEVIDGIGLLSQRYNGQLVESDAIERLASVRGGVNGLLARARKNREALSLPMNVAVASAAVEIINTGKRGTAKLRPWIEGES